MQIPQHLDAHSSELLLEDETVFHRSVLESLLNSLPETKLLVNHPKYLRGGFRLPRRIEIAQS